MVPKKTIDLFDHLIRWSFYALILLLPVGIAFVGTFAAFAIFFFLVKRICLVINNRPRGLAIFKMLLLPAPNFLNLPILLFVIAAAISMVFSQNHELSMMGFFGKLLRGVLLYISFLEVFTTLAFINQFVFVWLFSAFVVGLSGLCQYYFGYDFIRHLPLVSGRVSSTMRQANDFGTYIISICPLILVILTHMDLISKEMSKSFKNIVLRPVWLMAFLFLVYIVLVVCLGLTFSRSAWLGFFIAVFWAAFFRKVTLPYVLIIIVGFFWIFSPAMIATRDVSFITDNVKNVSLPAPGNQMPEAKNPVEYVQIHLGSGRFGFWKEAVSIIHDYPWWGSGINTYSQMGIKYKVTWGGYAHNSYLQLTAELGILGLTTFLWMFGVLFFYALRHVKKVPKGYARSLLIGVLASLSAHLIQSFFDTTFYSVQLSVLMWLMVAVVVATVRMNQLTKQPS